MKYMHKLKRKRKWNGVTSSRKWQI